MAAVFAAFGAGDAARLSDAGPLALTAGPSGAHVVIWETWADLQLR